MFRKYLLINLDAADRMRRLAKHDPDAAIANFLVTFDKRNEEMIESQDRITPQLRANMNKLYQFKKLYENTKQRAPPAPSPPPKQISDDDKPKPDEDTFFDSFLEQPPTEEAPLPETIFDSFETRIRPDHLTAVQNLITDEPKPQGVSIVNNALYLDGKRQSHVLPYLRYMENKQLKRPGAWDRFAAGVEVASGLRLPIQRQVRTRSQLDMEELS